MKYIKVDTYAELSKKAADIIAAQVLLKPNCVLGLATGSTPLGLYRELVNKCARSEVDFSEVVTVNLDEYTGIPDTNSQSYRCFMNKNLFSLINIKPENTFVPNGMAPDLKKECEDYDARIKLLGGIDLQLLGIGVDGHIGFNEPADAFVAATHKVDLDPSTIQANARFFNSAYEVPKQAITMGMTSIMQAKKILMVVNGKGKKQILEKALFGPITPKNQASLLQIHPDVTVIFTEEYSERS